jgi:signal transduction histidine kinase
MYGTVARLQLKPGMEVELKVEIARYPGLRIPGFVSTMIYHMDRDANEYLMVVAFLDKDSYFTNAHDPAQAKRYSRIRALLTVDPEWHDGEIVWSEIVAAIENTRLFNEVQDKSRQLELANRHKSEFLANMSHELRTPLNAVIGFSDVLSQQIFGEVNAKQSEYLEDIRSSGRHLLSLINDILDLSKIEAGRMELESSEFSLRHCLQSVVMMVRDRATRNDVRVETVIPPEVGTVWADERKIKQVVLNLMSNAVKFTPAGGHIELSARLADDNVVVSVRDTGVGIAAADQARVFEEFAQARSATTRDQEGTGLGLTLTKKFVELHGGRIWVQSEVGTGSTFSFTLPAHGPKG